MAQFKGRSNNSNRNWSSKLRLKPNEVVNHLGSLYQNVTGVNTEPGTSNDWVFSGLSNDNTLVHKGGEETITGKKIFQGNAEFNGTQPEIKLKENTNNRFIVLKTRDIGDGSLLIVNQEGKVQAIFKNNVGSGQPQFSVGNSSSIPIESQFYLYGGQNGANIDMRGRDSRDECNMDFEGADWETDIPNSLGFSYFGNQYSLGGDVLGYPKSRLAHIRFNQADHAIITSTNDLGVVPIRFGINGNEIANLNDKGIEYESEFSVDNTSNPRWLTDKAYVDNATGWEAIIDTAHTVGSPQTVAQGVTANLTNNKGTIFNSQLPTGVTTFFDSATSKITPQNENDFMTSSFMFKAKNSNADGHFTVYIDIPTLGERFTSVHKFPKGANTEHGFDIDICHFVSAQFASNGGIIKIVADLGDLEIYDKQFRFCRVHRAN